MSHSEIENFLSEINVDTHVDCEKTTKVSYMDFIEDSVQSVEPTPVVVNPLLTEVQYVRDFCKVWHIRREDDEKTE